MEPVGGNKTDDLIQTLYACALKPGSWRTFLDRFEESHPESARVLWYEDTTGRSVSIQADSGFESNALRDYADYYGCKNPWTKVMASQHAGTVHTDHMLTSRQILRNTEFFNDYLKPQGLAYGFGSTVLQDPGQKMFFSVLLPAPHEPGQDDLHLTSQIVPHLQRAVEIQNRLIDARGRIALLEAALNGMAFGVIVVDEHRRVEYLNSSASEILGANDGIAARNGYLSAAQPATHQQIKVRLASALNGGRPQQTFSNSYVHVERPSGLRAYSLMMAPFIPPAEVTWRASTNDAPAAIVFLTDPERTLDGPVTLFSRAYGLTRAESALLAQLVSSSSLGEVAAILRIRPETARFHTKNIFQKTGTHSQVELLNLVLRTVGSLVF
jgi:DNA-binding CsgD family transcriptional regulator/PAS domain-containing protein